MIRHVNTKSTAMTRAKSNLTIDLRIEGTVYSINGDKSHGRDIDNNDIVTTEISMTEL